LAAHVPQRSTVALVVLLALGACGTEEPGISPARDAFYFPTTAVLDPLRPILYVTNSNADLKYNGGTLMVLDLGKLPSDLSKVGERVKAGLLDCAADRTDPTIWECPEAQFIQPEATLRMSNYPAELRINSTGTRVFATLRGQTVQSHLLWADIVDRGGGKLDIRCNDALDSTGCGSVSGSEDCPIWDCDQDHKINWSESLQKNVPAEAYGLYFNELSAVHADVDGVRRTCRDGVSLVSCECGGKPRCSDSVTRECCIDPPAGVDYVYVTHLAGGEVSFFTSEPSRVVLRDIRAGFFTNSGDVHGGFAIAARTPGDPLSPVYLTSRVDNAIPSFSIRDSTRIIDGPRATVGAVSPGNDVRGLAFAPGGNRMYFADRLPPSLVALDMTIQDDGLPKHQPLWQIEACTEPSQIRLGANPLHPEDGPAQLVYVTCFSGAQIFVIDTSMGRVIDQILTGKGPNAMAIDGANRRAFIANFLDNTVGVIDLDPTHAHYNRMVLRIGRVTALIHQ
jgi:DNA-binding beta-propeller fold protein YncE